MSPPWMPLYIADYRKDTAHLSAAEHGAYLNLIMHYWSTSSIPDDDKQLARIACMTPAEWRRARPIVQAFFHDGWKHGRIDKEIHRTAEVSASYAARASQAAKKRWAKHSSSNASSIHEGMLGNAEPPSPSHNPEAKASGARKRATRLSPDWWPSLQNIDYAIAKGFLEQRVSIEAEKFRNYWTAKGGAGAAKLDWDATWQNWILNATERNGGPRNGGQQQSLGDIARELADEVRERERSLGLS